MRLNNVFHKNIKIGRWRIPVLWILFFLLIFLIVGFSFLYIYFIQNFVYQNITELIRQTDFQLLWIDAQKKEFFLFLGFCFLMSIVIMGIFFYIYRFFLHQNRTLYETAYMDFITGLGNEVYFNENVPKLLSCLQNGYIAVSDIYGFQAFHRLYDYDFCNSMLQAVGQRLVQVLPPGSIVCHLSRDMFAMVFDYSKEVDELFEQICSDFAQLRVDGKLLHLRVSIGGYGIKENDMDVHEILNKAYMAHSHIKKLNLVNHYFLFDDDLGLKVLEEQKIEAMMEEALEQGEFLVMYQPKIRCVDDDIVGAEALVRWKREDGWVFPDYFIPLFERNKFILKLDLYVFERVCQDMVEFGKLYGKMPMISVNVSKEHFIDENFIEDYIRIVKQYEIDPKLIELEITESAMADDGIDVLGILQRIRQNGFLVSIDDFGTGYSSLSMLQDIPMDVLKIDKRFIDNADLNSDRNVINYIVFIAKKIGVFVIVEGVETKDQVKFVKNLGCDMIQGYYYSKPIEKDDFILFWNQYVSKM